MVDINFALKVKSERSSLKVLFLKICSQFRVPLEESQNVFRNKPGYRKIVLSTNIAESSVTIPDVEVVIDFCLTKNLKSDPASNYIKLKLEWADGNSSTQVWDFFFVKINLDIFINIIVFLKRRGRCGRTCPGI